MFVPMVQIGQMGMSVRQRRMLMPVRVRPETLVTAVRVLMMLVMDVPMIVRQVFMGMFVGVLFRKYQPCGGRHQRQCDPERNGEWFTERKNCYRRADEGRSAEMRGGPRAAEMAQRIDEQHETDAITHEAEHQRPAAQSDGRELVPQCKRQNEIERPGGKPLRHCQHDRIGR